MTRYSMCSAVFTFASVAAIAACGGDDSGSGNNGGAAGYLVLDGGSGMAGMNSDGSTAGSGGSTTNTLTAVVRDFKKYDSADPTTNPDFENPPKNGNGPWDDPGIVASVLGQDDKPTYGSHPSTTTTHGAAQFDQWFRDVTGTNLRFEIPLLLTPLGNGTYSYDSEVSGVVANVPGGAERMFFPLDNQGFGNQGNSHNYHFTVEIHTKFIYKGGETFHFRGDDDVFTFIDKKLVIDLGGIHSPEEQTVQLDTLGLTPNQEYALDFFYAERHVVMSNLRIDTTIEFTQSIVK